ncbi:MAG TPA: hypothetical protein VJ861_10055, partial [Treponemataceae bacterium]|nr:hypothetical protein [Treponemataceae bacterium]
MENNKIYGNTIPAHILKKAERRYNRYARKYSFDPDQSPSLECKEEGQGFIDFDIQTVVEKEVPSEKEVSPAQSCFDKEKGIVLGTIRMGFGHCRMAIALASAAHSLGYTPYWMDLMSFSDSAASKTIKHLEDLYNLGS